MTVAVAVAAALAGCGVVLVLCLVAGEAVGANVAAAGAVTVNLAGYGCSELGWSDPVVGWALGSGLGQGLCLWVRLWLL